MTAKRKYTANEEQARRVCLDALKRLKQEQIEGQIQEANKEIKAALADGDEQKYSETMAKLRNLRRQVKNIVI